MTIGVICTCAPSLSKMLQEHPHSYATIKSRLRYSFSSTVHFLSKGSAKSSSKYQRRDLDPYNGDHNSYKERLTGGRTVGDRAYELHNGSFSRPLVGEGSSGFAAEDSSHLNGQTASERAVGTKAYQGDDRIWAPLPAVTEADMV